MYTNKKEQFRQFRSYPRFLLLNRVLKKLFFSRLLSKFHLVNKTAFFGIFFIKFLDHVNAYPLKIVHFFNQSEFRKKSVLTILCLSFLCFKNQLIFAETHSSIGKEKPLSLETFIHPKETKKDPKAVLLAPNDPSLPNFKDRSATPSPDSVSRQAPNTPAPPQQSIDYTLDYPISIVLSPLEKAVLSSLIADNIEVITKKMGDPFRKGEVLIKMDQRAFKARVLKARAAVEKAKVVLQVKEQLFKDKVASRVEIVDAESAFNIATAELMIAEKEFSDTVIIAPFQGHVVDVYVEEFEMVQPGQKMIAIVNSGVLVAKMLVPSMYLKELYIGQPIQLRIKENHDLIDAKITQIGVVIDPASSMVKVFAEIDNRRGRLTPGMIGTAKLEQPQNNTKNKESQTPPTHPSGPYGLTPPQNKIEPPSQPRPVTR